MLDGAALARNYTYGFLSHAKLLSQKLKQAPIGLSLLRRGCDLNLEHLIKQAAHSCPAAAGHNLRHENHTVINFLNR